MPTLLSPFLYKKNVFAGDLSQPERNRPEISKSRPASRLETVRSQLAGQKIFNPGRPGQLASPAVAFPTPYLTLGHGFSNIDVFFSDVSFGGRGGGGRACRLGLLAATTAEVLQRWEFLSSRRLRGLCVMCPQGRRLADPIVGSAGGQRAQNTQH